MLVANSPFSGPEEMCEMEQYLIYRTTSFSTRRRQLPWNGLWPVLSLKWVQILPAECKSGRPTWNLGVCSHLNSINNRTTKIKPIL